jgi:hypothetical protein
MKKILRVLLVVLLLGGWSLAALALHVVVAPGSPARVIVVPKNQLGIRQTYVDTRKWTIGDVSSHPEVTRRLIDAGKADALSQVTKPGDDVVAVLDEAIGAKKP